MDQRIHRQRGTVAVSSDDAGLWTDFRYWIQAADELKNSDINLFRVGDEDFPTLENWLAANLSAGSRIGVDGRTITSSRAMEIEKRLNKAGISLVTDQSAMDRLWTGRPELPATMAVELDEDESGDTRGNRLNRLRESLSAEGADTWIGIGLDSAAWLLNVRGGDVPYSPVLVGFLIAGPEYTTWFTDESKLPEDVRQSLGEDGIIIAPYGDFENSVASLAPDSVILADHSSISRAVIDRLPDGIRIIEGRDPVIDMKARKNKVETANISRAMEKDGVAMVRFFIELEKNLEAGGRPDELEAASMLLDQRKAIPGFLGESFSPIPAVGGHGAICHYEARPGSVDRLRKGSGLFLIDSGGQWEEGTTDITRTLSLGTPTKRQIADYTLTLKGHVALSRARFPRGTRGYQLDTLARMFLWEQGMNFGHGTGHGVGYRLNVHEGPQKISPHPVDVVIEEGMLISNEPGVYREGEYGIRIENLVLCREDRVTEFGAFLAFDTLTLAPYDRRLIDVAMLSGDERAWIDAYHEEVNARLAPMLEEEERVWLEEHTAPLSGN